MHKEGKKNQHTDWEAGITPRAFVLLAACAADDLDRLQCVVCSVGFPLRPGLAVRS